MSFLKKLAGLFGGGGAPADRGFFVYIKIQRTGEVVRLRLRPGYDLSIADDGKPFARKVIIGQRGFERVDAELYFDKNYNLVNAEISGGELSDEEAYFAQQEAAPN